MNAALKQPIAETESKPKLTGSRCKCSACGEFFNSVSVFDLHRTGLYPPKGVRRCRTPEEMLSKGYLRNAGGFWIRCSGLHRTRGSGAKPNPIAEAPPEAESDRKPIEPGPPSTITLDAVPGVDADDFAATVVGLANSMTWDGDPAVWAQFYEQVLVLHSMAVAGQLPTVDGPKS